MVTGDQGEGWQLAEVNMVWPVEQGPKHIVLEAVRGNGWLSDIPVDDVELKDGSCPGN